MAGGGARGRHVTLAPLPCRVDQLEHLDVLYVYACVAMIGNGRAWARAFDLHHCDNVVLNHCSERSRALSVLGGHSHVLTVLCVRLLWPLFSPSVSDHSYAQTFFSPLLKCWVFKLHKSQIRSKLA